ncbi:hypothetical protein NFJ02_20g42740 [Pycnococcus provasolii]
MVNTEMHKLCCNRTWDEVKRRIESHPQEAREENHGNLPLHYALGGNASVDVIGKLLAAYPGGAQVKNTDGDLPLHFAAYKASIDVIDKLLEAYPKGAQVKNNDGNLSLHYALDRSASVDVIGKLLAAYPGGAQVKNTDGDLPLHWAVYKGSGDVIDMLLAAYSEGAQVKNKNGNLPLHHALINEASVDVIVKVFAEHPGGVQVKNNCGDVPLFAKLKNIGLAVGEPWVDAHARGDSELQDHMKSAVVATVKRDPSAISTLLNNGVNLGQFVDTFLHPVHLAAHFAIPTIVKRLVNANRHLCGARFHGCTALHIACCCAPERELGITTADIQQTVQNLVKAGCDVNAIADNDHSMTPLLYAARDGCIESVEMLLDAKANAGATCALGQTALHKAASRGDADMTRLLLTRGVPRDAADNQGLTAHELASERKCKQVIAVIENRAGRQAVDLTADKESHAGVAAVAAAAPFSTQHAIAQWLAARQDGPRDLGEVDADIPRTQLRNNRPAFALRYQLVNHTTDHSVMRMGVAFPKAVAFCQERKEAWNSFKIGITDDPKRQAKHGYPHSGYCVRYDRMDVIFRGTRDLADALETYLIAVFNMNGFDATDKCDNDQPSDDGDRVEGRVYYVYVVSR